MNSKRLNPNKLKQARGERSPESIAAELGVSVATIRNYENGNFEPTATRLYLLAEILGKPLEWFFEARTKV